MKLLGEEVDTALRQKELRQAKERAETEMRESRDRAEMLLREVNHRVANSLALVAALTHRQTGTVSDQVHRDGWAEVRLGAMPRAGSGRAPSVRFKVVVTVKR